MYTSVAGNMVPSDFKQWPDVPRNLEASSFAVVLSALPTSTSALAESPVVPAGAMKGHR